MVKKIKNFDYVICGQSLKCKATTQFWNQLEDCDLLFQQSAPNMDGMRNKDFDCSFVNLGCELTERLICK